MAVPSRAYAGQSRLKENLNGYLFFLPAAAILATFYLVPALRLFYTGFTKASMMSTSSTFTGFDNFSKMITDGDFHNALLVSLLTVVMIVPLQTLLALVMSVFVNQKLRGVKAFRTMYFVPAIISFVAVCVMFKQMYSVSTGLANTLLGALGMPPLKFLSSTSQALPSLVFACIWKSWGYFMVIFLSGLQDIPMEIRESARIDGANPVQEFLYITVPQLKNVFFFVLIITTMDALKLFIPTHVMTSGNPRGVTDVIVHYIYRTAFRLDDVGYASAMSTVLFIVVVGITLLQFRLAGRRAED